MVSLHWVRRCLSGSITRILDKWTLSLASGNWINSSQYPIIGIQIWWETKIGYILSVLPIDMFSHWNEWCYQYEQSIPRQSVSSTRCIIWVPQFASRATVTDRLLVQKRLYWFVMFLLAQPLFKMGCHVVWSCEHSVTVFYSLRYNSFWWVEMSDGASMLSPKCSHSTNIKCLQL